MEVVLRIEQGCRVLAGMQRWLWPAFWWALGPLTNILLTWALQSAQLKNVIAWCEVASAAPIGGRAVAKAVSEGKFL